MLTILIESLIGIVLFMAVIVSVTLKNSLTLGWHTALQSLCKK